MAQRESDMGILPLTNMNFILPPPNEKAERVSGWRKRPLGDECHRVKQISRILTG
jgi:hypothetical protein